MKVNNLTRLTLTLSTLCLASTLFCSANAHTALKKGSYDASVAYPLGDKVTMVGKPMVCTYAVLPNGKTGYRWEPLHSAVHIVALNRPLEVTGSPLPAGAHVGATLDTDNNVDAYMHNIHAKFKEVRDADNALGMEMQTSSANHVRLLKNIMQNSSLYEFNLVVQTVSPKLSQVLNSTLAFYQRQRTNILLAALVAKQHEVTTKATIPFSSGKNALLLHVHGKTIPFFQFVHDFHAQHYVQQCMIPVVRHGDVTIGQLHRAWNMFAILGNLNTYNTLYRLHHCKLRSHKWNDRLHHAPLRALHAAALLAAANHAMANQHNNEDKTPVTASLLTRLREAKAQWLLHPTVKSAGAYLKMRHSIEEADADIKNGIKKTEAYISQHNMQSNDAALAELKASLSAGGGGITILPGGFNFISEKQIEKFAKDVLAEKMPTVAPIKAVDNVNDVAVTDLGKAFASPGYSNNATSPEVYKGQAAGYYRDSKPIHELDIHAPSYSTGNGGIDLYAPQNKAGKKA